VKSQVFRRSFSQLKNAKRTAETTTASPLADNVDIVDISRYLRFVDPSLDLLRKSLSHVAGGMFPVGLQVSIILGID